MPRKIVEFGVETRKFSLASLFLSLEKLFHFAFLKKVDYDFPNFFLFCFCDLTFVSHFDLIKFETFSEHANSRWGAKCKGIA